MASAKRKPLKADLDHIVAPLRDLAVPCADLVLDPKNARLHDERNLDAIASSLRRFGQRLPIVVQQTGMVVRAGNGRLLAARQMGWQHIAAVVTDDADEMAAAFALADNRTAELAAWDEKVLAEALASLRDSEDLTPLDLGWDAEEVEKITGMFDVDGTNLPGLDSSKTSPFEQITFTLTHDQAATVKKALSISKGNGDFGDTGNPNSNGNTIARICAEYCER